MINLEDNIPLDSAKSISGIDALYFYVKVDYEHYTSFYHNFLLKGKISNLDNIILNSSDYSKQFTYYTYNIDISSQGSSPSILPLCRIGFKNLNQKDNLDSIVVQMDSSMMNYLGYKSSTDIVLNFIRLISLDPISTKVSRVDLNTYVTGHNFEYVNYDLFSTRSRISGTIQPICKDGVIETFYMGSRSTDSVFMRIYNKSKELAALAKKDYLAAVFKKLLIENRFKSKHGDLIEIGSNLWNIEFEVKRGTLRRYMIHTIDDLFNNVDSLHYDIVKNNFRMLTRPKNKINNIRIETSDIWKIITEEYHVFNKPVKIDKEKLKVYEKDDLWLMYRMVEFINEPGNKNSSMMEDVQKFLLKYPIK